jgi:hypothetical protein
MAKVQKPQKAITVGTLNEIQMLKGLGIAPSLSLVRTAKIVRPNKHIQIRTSPDGRKYEWHPTEGFRRWI